jgi:hypothetical protein
MSVCIANKIGDTNIAGFRGYVSVHIHIITSGQAKAELLLGIKPNLNVRAYIVILKLNFPVDTDIFAGEEQVGVARPLSEQQLGAFV